MGATLSNSSPLPVRLVRPIPGAAGTSEGASRAARATTAPDRILSPRLCQEARTLLDLEEGELAFVARVPLTLLQDYERGAGQPPASALVALRRALERGGVVFTPEDGGRGVRLR